MLRSLIIAAALAASPAVPLAETLAITNAHIVTEGPSGDITSGTIVVKDGKIAAVGPGVTAPAGARIIDAHGGIATPGLIAIGAPIGLSEVSEGVPETDDSSTASDQISAAFDVQYAVNPNSLAIPIARLGGITDAILTPGERRSRGTRPESLMFNGQAAVIDLGGGMDLLEKTQAGMALDMGEDGARRAGGSRAAQIVILKALLQDVRDYAKTKANYDLGHSRAFSLSQPDLEALIPVVEGREPLIVSVHRAADILQVLKLAREEKLTIILEGAEEGYMVAPRIAAAHVPVMVHAFEDLPSSFDQIGATLTNPARLAAAGVTLAIENPSFYTGARTPRIDAGRAVAHGLPMSVALASITITPAKIFGVADRIGSIEVGKDADIVVWSGDPLEPLSAPTSILVKGVEAPLRDRDLDLRDRYMAIAGLKPAP
jgi:imidazolonepropionase-like amidohydrolase